MQLIKVPEPEIMFAYEQRIDDPRDGLSLFGPVDEGRPYGIRAGAIGTQAGLKRFRAWVKRLQGPIKTPDIAAIARPSFPGFEAAFRTKWDLKPVIEICLAEDALRNCYLLKERYHRVFNTVNTYADPIIKATREDEEKVDIWFVIIPEEVYKYCRPQSSVESEISIQVSNRLSRNAIKLSRLGPALFEEADIAALPYQFEVNFHNQLKAKLLSCGCPIQILRETTIAHKEFLDNLGRPIRDLDIQLSTIAWCFSSAVFYKAGGRPWKIGSARKGVCYLGITFKRDNLNLTSHISCCAAQMFMDSGDGVVFKGALGPWYNSFNKEFHINRNAAKDLLQKAIDTYKDKAGHEPMEIFIHGRTYFSNEEWEGFNDVVGPNTNLVGVRIREADDFKLFRKQEFPVLRGLAYVQNGSAAYLWTKGYVPRLRTYPGREVPNPLSIKICRGKADIETVLQDIMVLTKLNYNACTFASGQPITLKFSNAIGEILTAGPIENMPPHQFRFYI